MVEHRLAKARVEGSNPFSRSKSSTLFHASYVCDLQGSVGDDQIVRGRAEPKVTGGIEYPVAFEVTVGIGYPTQLIEASDRAKLWLVRPAGLEPAACGFEVTSVDEQSPQ